MTPQAMTSADAPQAKADKGLLTFMRARTRGGFAQPTVRALGQTWSSEGRRAPRRPVLE